METKDMKTKIDTVSDKAKDMSGKAAEVASKGGAAAKDAHDGAGQGAMKAGHRLEETAQKVGHGAKEMATKAVHAVQETAEKAVHGAKEVATKFEHVVHELADKAGDKRWDVEKWTKALVVSTLLSGVLGCGAIDRAIDCQRICDKKKECIDNNYKVSNCVDYCKSNAENNTSYAQKVNDCSACFETRACVQAAECYLKGSCPSLP